MQEQWSRSGLRSPAGDSTVDPTNTVPRADSRSTAHSPLLRVAGLVHALDRTRDSSLGRKEARKPDFRRRRTSWPNARCRRATTWSRRARRCRPRQVHLAFQAGERGDRRDAAVSKHGHQPPNGLGRGRSRYLSLSTHISPKLDRGAGFVPQPAHRRRRPGAIGHWPVRWFCSGTGDTGLRSVAV